MGLGFNGETDTRFGGACAVCGNGNCQVDLGENEFNCQEDCDLGEPIEICGNGIVEGTEACDDGNTVDEAVAECTYGQQSCILGCSSNCLSDISGTPNYCGDGNADSGNGEHCDDGNANNGDGCSSGCISVFGPAQTITTLVSDPSGIEWHPSIGKLIAIDNRNGRIYKMNSDGTNLQQIATGLGDLEGLAIADYNSQYVYVSPE